MNYRLALIAAPLLFASASSAQIVMDGVADDAYGAARAVQNTRTGFGDASLGLADFCDGSELDQGFAVIDGDSLYILLAGNLQSNWNHLEVFIDAIPGEGQNRLLSNNPDIDFGALGNMGEWGVEGDKDYAQGFTFDEGVDPDFWITYAGGNDPFETWLSYSQLLTGGGTEALNNFGGPGAADLDGVITTPDGIEGTINNSNTLGVTSCDKGGCEGGDGSGVITGLELRIPLALLGHTDGDTIKITAFVNNDNHFYVANQFLPGINGWGNLAYTRWVNLANIDGDQYFTVETGGGGEPCIGDLTGDGMINGADVGLMLAAWGNCPAPCPADLTGDGMVNGADIGLMLAGWGDCP